jgi:hypothetical protein
MEEDPGGESVSHLIAERLQVARPVAPWRSGCLDLDACNPPGPVFDNQIHLAPSSGVAQMRQPGGRARGFEFRADLGRDKGVEEPSQEVGVAENPGAIHPLYRRGQRRVHEVRL